MTVFLYVIGTEKDDYCKVGITANVADRLKALQTASPHELAVKECWDFPDGNFAREAEQLAHVALKAYRARGEWFTIGAADAISRLTIWFFWAACASAAENGEARPATPEGGLGLVAIGAINAAGRFADIGAGQ